MRHRTGAPGPTRRGERGQSCGCPVCSSRRVGTQPAAAGRPPGRSQRDEFTRSPRDLQKQPATRHPTGAPMIRCSKTIPPISRPTCATRAVRTVGRTRTPTVKDTPATCLDLSGRCGASRAKTPLVPMQLRPPTNYGLVVMSKRQSMRTWRRRMGSSQQRVCRHNGLAGRRGRTRRPARAGRRVSYDLRNQRRRPGESLTTGSRAQTQHGALRNSWSRPCWCAPSLPTRDATTLGALAEARARFSATGGTLHVRCHTSHGRRLLTLIGLDDMLDDRA